MRSSPGANRYWRGRLPSHQWSAEEAGTAITGSMLREVRGDRAGRTPLASTRAAQNFTTTASRATELWIGTLRRVPS